MKNVSMRRAVSWKPRLLHFISAASGAKRYRQMRIRGTLLWFLAISASVMAELSAPVFAAETPPYEVIKDHVDIVLSADGTFVETREEVYRPLNAAGIKLLQQRQLAYTREYEKLDVLSAVRRRAANSKKNVSGAASDVISAGELPASINLSYGQGGVRSFYGNDVITLSYPDLMVGDDVVLVSRLQQITPWFAGQFDLGRVFSRTVVSHDVEYRLSAPAAMKLYVDSVGLAGGALVAEDDVRHWVWQFANSTPVPLPTDAVSEADFAPHLNISTFASYADVAAAYRERSAGKSPASREIAALAASLTRNVTDRREQTRLLYNWVSTHIAYIAIELGAGGFTPHSAADVLENRFGDCKDHVVLLESLLAAKDIETTAALINAGENRYQLPDAASPHAFDHVITYVPEFDLFLDSSDGAAPFGVLPYADMGKPVLLANTGTVLRTPVPAGDSEVQIESSLVTAADGAVTGHTVVHASGAYGVSLRHLMQSIARDKQTIWLNLLIGHEAEGEITGSDVTELQDPFVMTANYHMVGALPAATAADVPASLSFRPVSFADLAGRLQPADRGNDYVCPSLRAVENLTLMLPPGGYFENIPPKATVDVPGIRFKAEHALMGSQTLNRVTQLAIDHPTASCSPVYYRQIRDAQQNIVRSLGQKARYSTPLPEAVVSAPILP